MEHHVTLERKSANANWRFRANYAANYPAGTRGTPHPFAGQPDIYRMATGLNSVWLEGLRKGTIKKTPKGYVHKAHVVEAQITPDNVFIRVE